MMFHEYSHYWKEIFRLADFIQLFAQSLKKIQTMKHYSEF